MRGRHLGSQDTYYVGTTKGVGWIYQQTFVDTYARVAVCKLYTEKTALVGIMLRITLSGNGSQRQTC